MKRNILVLFILLCLILLTIIINTGNSDNTNKNYVSIVDNQELVIENILPLTDEVGSTFSRSNSGSNIYYKFKIKSNYNKKAKYRILLSTKDGKEFIDNKYIKILLSDSDDNILKEYKTDSVKLVTGLEQFNNKYVVYSDSLKGGAEEEFILRMWVADSAVYSDELIFDGKLSVYSY